TMPHRILLKVRAPRVDAYRAAPAASCMTGGCTTWPRARATDLRLDSPRDHWLIPIRSHVKPDSPAKRIPTERPFGVGIHQLAGGIRDEPSYVSHIHLLRADQS